MRNCDYGVTKHVRAVYSIETQLCLCVLRESVIIALLSMLGFAANRYTSSRLC